eukprot:jgi/Bigna1/141842/aug1.65_g16550
MKKLQEEEREEEKEEKAIEDARGKSRGNDKGSRPEPSPPSALSSSSYVEQLALCVGAIPRRARRRTKSSSPHAPSSSSSSSSLSAVFGEGAAALADLKKGTSTSPRRGPSALGDSGEFVSTSNMGVGVVNISGAGALGILNEVKRRIGLLKQEGGRVGGAVALHRSPHYDDDDEDSEEDSEEDEFYDADDYVEDLEFEEKARSSNNNGGVSIAQDIKDGDDESDKKEKKKKEEDDEEEKGEGGSQDAISAASSSVKDNDDGGEEGGGGEGNGRNGEEDSEELAFPPVLSIYFQNVVAFHSDGRKSWRDATTEGPLLMPTSVSVFVGTESQNDRTRTFKAQSLLRKNYFEVERTLYRPPGISREEKKQDHEGKFAAENERGAKLRRNSPMAVAVRFNSAEFLVDQTLYDQIIFWTTEGLCEYTQTVQWPPYAYPNDVYAWLKVQVIAQQVAIHLLHPGGGPHWPSSRHHPLAFRAPKLSMDKGDSDREEKRAGDTTSSNSHNSDKVPPSSPPSSGARSRVELTLRRRREQQHAEGLFNAHLRTAVIGSSWACVRSRLLDVIVLRCNDLHNLYSVAIHDPILHRTPPRKRSSQHQHQQQVPREGRTDATTTKTPLHTAVLPFLSPEQAAQLRCAILSKRVAGGDGTEEGGGDGDHRQQQQHGVVELERVVAMDGEATWISFENLVIELDLGLFKLIGGFFAHPFLVPYKYPIAPDNYPEISYDPPINDALFWSRTIKLQAHGTSFWMPFQRHPYSGNLPMEKKTKKGKKKNGGESNGETGREEKEEEEAEEEEGGDRGDDGTALVVETSEMGVTYSRFLHLVDQDCTSNQISLQLQTLLCSICPVSLIRDIQGGVGRNGTENHGAGPATYYSAIHTLVPDPSVTSDIEVWGNGGEGGAVKRSATDDDHDSSAYR